MTHKNLFNRRYLAIVFPWLSIERLRNTHPHLFAGRDDAPIAFVEQGAGGIRLQALNCIAAQAGLTRGLTLTDARVRVPQLVTFTNDRDADQKWLERLADGCHRYTPLVAIDPPDALVLDIAGCAHAYDGERRLAADVQKRLARRGLMVRHAFGNTADAARALARYSGAPAPDERGAIRRLPVAALGLHSEATTALKCAGLKTVGDVMSRPLSGIAARFGEEAVTRVRRLSGEITTPITPRKVMTPIRAEHRFGEPIAHVEYALRILATLTKKICAQLAERHQGARRLEARLFRSDGIVQRLHVETGYPTRDVTALMRLFSERIDGLADPIDPGFGYDMIRLDVSLSERLDSNQLQLQGGEGANEATAELIDRLSTRFGRNRVLRFLKRDSHIPEQAELMIPAVAERPSGGWKQPEPEEPPQRPIYLFDPPQPIESILAEVPDGPPLRFRWRRKMHEVARSEGPERIAGEWWRQTDAPTRDYFRIEDNYGRRFWIFRQGLYAETKNPRWYLHGLFA